jgi:hypothetical protein
MTLINNFDSLQNAPNASGAPWFQVVRPEDVASIPDVILDQISSAITLNGGAYAYNIMATVGTVQWSESTQQMGGRTVYKSVFSFVIPKDRADVLNYAKHLNNRGVIAIVRDANGQNRLMGTADEPATFQLSARTLGQARGGRNEHRYEIVLVSGKPVPFYEVTTHLPAPSNVCPPFPSVALAVSDTTPEIGDTITLTATASGITPSSYTFYLPQKGGNIKTVTQASNVYNWVVDFAGTGPASVSCTDATDYTISTATSVTATGLTLDYIASPVTSACALFNLYKAFTGAVVNIRRSSDNATSDFTYAELADGTAVSWVGGGNTGYVTCIYDQSGNYRHIWQTTGSWQGIIIEGGAVVTSTSGQFAYRQQNGTQSMYATSQMKGKTTCTVLCTEINAITSGTQAWLYTYAGNPALGTYSSNPADTSSATTNSGSPIYQVNGTVTTGQRGAMGTALIGVEARTIIVDADFDKVNWRNVDRQNIMHYADTSSTLSAMITFNLWDDSERSTLETNLANQYG